MHVLALDPGKATGYAVWKDGEFHASSYPYQTCLDRFMSRITHPDAYEAYDAVVCEDFLITERTTKTHSTVWRKGQELEMIGCFRWACGIYGVEFSTQTAKQAKTFSTDKKLKKLGWWTTGTDHPRDATRHLVRYLFNHGEIDPSELLVVDE